ncbi:MAG: 4a-hydroxytetrahydrobiopterin dehydratase [Proteobacteria bacterium]|jgi:4a-hydroxytetrahydrobiopterin dehydratase|nr:4a-hydroxytetrahydrobiopterin dehydratase [Pseudomonadota bacterium]
MNLSDQWHQTPTSLVRHYKFKNFREALAFTNSVGAIAETQKHHPDLKLGWGYLEITITTHDAGHTLTEKDFKLAAAIDQII